MDLFTDSIYLLLCIPLITGIYPFYLLLKPDTNEDKYFLFFGDVKNAEYLVNHLTVLEKEQGKNYQPHRTKIREYFMDYRLSPAETRTIEKIIIHSYFAGFRNRWIAYQKADWLLRSIFLTPLVICSIVFFEQLFQFAIREGFEGVLLFLLICIVVAMPTLLLVVVFNTGFSLYIHFMSMVFGKSGRIQRARKIYDQMLYSLHPLSNPYKKRK